MPIETGSMAHADPGVPIAVHRDALKGDGSTHGFSGAMRSVSGRRQLEGRFRQLLESAPDATVIVSSHGMIVLTNTLAQRLFGYRRHQWIGQPVEMLVAARCAATLALHRARFFAEPQARDPVVPLQLDGVHAGGTEFPVEASMNPLDTEAGLFISIAMRDVTERKRFEQALQDKNLELEAAALVKDRFLASMSHELRTPLNAIIGFTGTLLMRLPGPLNADQEHQLETIQTSARHLHSLINDLLDLAKIEAGKVELLREQVSCREVLEELDAVLRPAAQAKGLGFRLAVPAPELVVWTDRRALTQILLNLTNNAIKFTDRGEVGVELRQQRDDAGKRCTSFTVADTGPGIRAADRDRLFRSFEQLGAPGAGQQEGAGLGLHLSQKLAVLLGGEIHVASESPNGCRFTLALYDR